MEDATNFDRCVYCFAPKQETGPCMKCGYEPGACDFPALWLSPGSVLKGQFVTGKILRYNQNQIVYYGWDMKGEQTVDIVEYFPTELVTRYITDSEAVITIPGREAQVEAGRQDFFQRAKFFRQCVSHGEKENPLMDFFCRNNTCYYVMKREN